MSIAKADEANVGGAEDAAGFRAVCDQCGATPAWDAVVSALKCGACGHTQPLVPAPEAEIVEHDLSEALVAARPRWNLGTAARQVKCSECGAVIEFPDGVVATRCSFCDSPSVLVEPARADLLAPESLVPFAVSREQATASFRAWLGGLWFRPSDLREKAKLTELRGVYVPYWTFDADVTSHWTADAGYYYYETETYTTTENGRRVTRTQKVRRVRWVPTSGSRQDHYDDHLVCASLGVPRGMVDEVGDFDTSRLVPFAPAYLQGFAAESYAVDLARAWALAREKIAAEQRARCRGDVPGDTQRNLRATHRFSNTTFKHVLLPVWVAAFRYRDRVYRFLVNGQTGKVAGQAPWSVVKIVLFSALLLGVAGLLYALVGQRP